MATTTLKDYYQLKGQNLPTILDRAKIFEQHGLGSASAYSGSYDQNVSLLNRLNSLASKPATPIAAPAPIIPAPTAPKPILPASPANPPAPVAPPVTATQPDNTYTGLYNKLKTDFGLDSLINTIKGAFTGQPKKADLYNTELASAGVNKDQTDLTNLDSRITAINTALGQSEKDIRDRINASGGIVTDSQVQRLVAAEKAPLVAEYQALTGARGSLADRITKSQANASNMADLKYSDAMQPYTSAKEQLSALTPEFNQVLSAGEKDLTSRLNSLTTAKKATYADDKSFALKGYKTINPADMDRLKKEGYDVIAISGRAYAKAPAKPVVKATQKTTTNHTTTIKPIVPGYDSAKTELEKTKGDGKIDSYWNTDVYKRLRDKAKSKTDFDKNFAYNLNPNDSTASGFVKKTTQAPDVIPVSKIDAQSKAELNEAKDQLKSYRKTREEIIKDKPWLAPYI